MSPSEQIALVEDDTNSSFLPSLMFLPLTHDTIWSIANTPDERIKLFEDLKRRAVAIHCEEGEDIEDFVEPPGFNEAELNAAKDRYVEHELQKFHNQSSPGKTVHVYIAYDRPDDDLPGAGVVGIISYTLLDGEKIVFRYYKPTPAGDLYAAIAYINWTCSFTNQKEIADLLKDKMAKHPDKKLSVGSFLLYNLTRVFRNYANTTSTVPINLIILFSVALRTARKAHRKVGKRSTCKFLLEWISIVDDRSTVLDYFDYKLKPVYMMYTYPPLTETFTIFPEGLEPVPDLNIYQGINQGTRLNNIAYKCPSGYKSFPYIRKNNGGIEHAAFLNNNTNLNHYNLPRTKKSTNSGYNSSNSNSWYKYGGRRKTRRRQRR